MVEQNERERAKTETAAARPAKVKAETGKNICPSISGELSKYTAYERCLRLPTQGMNNLLPVKMAWRGDRNFFGPAI